MTHGTAPAARIANAGPTHQGTVRTFATSGVCSGFMSRDPRRHDNAGVPEVEGASVRFGVSHVLDAIERRISIDPTAAGGVIDLGEVVRLVDLDGGRPAHLLRLGLVIDALARHLSDGAVAIYAVADRALMSDTDLTANERMVIRRWSDDGKVEVVRAGGPAAASRIREVAALTGLPLLTRNPGGYPGPSYAPVPGPTGPALAAHQLGAGPAAPANVFSRNWRCPERVCASFGA